MDAVEQLKNVRAFGSEATAVSLMAGSPGPETLKDCKDILLKATSVMLDEDAGNLNAFRYGPDDGDLDFRRQLAAFLSQQYGDTVDSGRLMVSAGATQALQMICTVLFTSHTLVVVEDPTYFAAYHMLQRELGMDIVAVPFDEEGMDPEALDQLLTARRPKVQEDRQQPFWAMVYMIPVFHNPTGRCYSPRRCRRLVELARKHDVLLVAEDVYNLIHFGESHPPPRLLSYDNPTDSDYKGHVLSSGTFSKILAPGLRLGWVEGPEYIVNLLNGSFYVVSGGSPNHYASRLAAAALKLGLQAEHLTHIRHVYKKRRDAVCKILGENLPQGATFIRPEGGFFVWIEFPKGTDTYEMVKWIFNKYHVFFLPGVCTSVEGNCRHCARVSWSFCSEDVLVEAVSAMCKGAKEFLGQ